MNYYTINKRVRYYNSPCDLPFGQVSSYTPDLKDIILGSDRELESLFLIGQRAETSVLIGFNREHVGFLGK